MRDPGDFARLGADGRPPEGLLFRDCAADGARFGVLASGSLVRLFDTAGSGGSAAASYLELDASLLQVDDVGYLALLGPDYLAEGGFDDLASEARAFGARLRKRLDATIRDRALPALARGLGDWARAQGLDLGDDAVRVELEHASLTLVFRLLFVLYAESARYLPLDVSAYERHSLKSLVDEAASTHDLLDDSSTVLWTQVRNLVHALRDGRPAWGVPAYNGALFAPDGFEGAALLERCTLPDTVVAEVLLGLGRDADDDVGVDYSTLEIGHLGHIYEGLLSLRLSVADVPMRYDGRRDAYEPAAAGEEGAVAAGGLLWQTHEGGRKGGGVYYTRTELVRHLVTRAVLPAFDEHLERVAAEADADPAAAARHLFDFAVLDPACGSAHFLVEVVDVLADRLVRFLADRPLPAVREMVEALRAGALAGAEVDDVALLRRLVLKRCVFGVDVSPMGAEVAKLSLWLATFVPGLSLAYLDRNVVVGNSLVGVLDPQAVRAYQDSRTNTISVLDAQLGEALAAARTALAALRDLDDRTKEEVERSAEIDARARAATAGLGRLFDVWTAEPFGVGGARHHVDLHGASVLEGRADDVTAAAAAAREEHRFLHWVLEFPHVFGDDRAGFDAVVGNPPWNEVTVERLAFYALFRPGLRALPARERDRALDDLLRTRPDLPERYERASAAAEVERRYFAAGEYDAMPGDPDLYKFFCQRYRALLRPGGRLGVVLPRTTFLAKGSRAFRRWLFEESTCERVDFLLNSGRWAFDAEPRYTVSLVCAARRPPPPGHRVEVAGVASSLDAWERQSATPGIRVAPDAFGPDWMTPLLPGEAAVGVLAKLQAGTRFPLGGGRWRCFPVAELHETHDRALWATTTKGAPLWKGESFDQYAPHGAGARAVRVGDALWRKVRKSRPGQDSDLAAVVGRAERAEAVARELTRARVAFRDVSRATDSRTTRACLVPAGVFLTNKAPYLAFVGGTEREQAACLAVMNSLPFDWQARRFVETNMNFFVLEALAVPPLDDGAFGAVATAAARLSCPDERFADFAAATGVEVGPLDDAERDRLRVEIDAWVARAWGLDGDDLEVVLADFTTDAVSAPYRDALRARFAELA
jgi:hypothetical protein